MEHANQPANPMQTEQTERGFNIIKFTDRYGQACSLQESSLAFESAIWLGVDAGTNQRMHLTQEQVAVLLPHLQEFVENGGIRLTQKTKP